MRASRGGPRRHQRHAQHRCSNRSRHTLLIGRQPHTEAEHGPPPGLGSVQMRPPWASTIVREIDRPTPMPCGLVVTNGWNSRAAAASSRPEPVSATLTTAISSSTLVETASSRRTCPHRVKRIANEIDEHLLSLHAVNNDAGATERRSHPGRRLSSNRYAEHLLRHEAETANFETTAPPPPCG